MFVELKSLEAALLVCRRGVGAVALNSGEWFLRGLLFMVFPLSRLSARVSEAEVPLVAVF